MTNRYSDKFAPIDTVMPFEPLSSGKTPEKAKLIVDDRRKFFESLPGITFANEVLVPAAGVLWETVYDNPIPELVEILKLTLPRPEPVTLVWTPFKNETSRFKEPVHLYAEAGPTGASNQDYLGRIIIEWGTGSQRNWTYVDATNGALQLPAITNLKVSGWSNTVDMVVHAVAQIGYAHSQLDATWTYNYAPADLVLENRDIPNFGKDITGYIYSPSILDIGSMYLQDDTLLNTIIMEWSLRPAIAPNPQVIPYAPISVPITGVAQKVALKCNVGPDADFNLTAVVKVRI